MKIKFDDLTIFGNNLRDQADALAMMGIVKITFFCQKHSRVEERRITRDLNNSNVNWSLVPYNAPDELLPPHFREGRKDRDYLTFIDVDKQQWRCCRADLLLFVDNVVEVED